MVEIGMEIGDVGDLYLVAFSLLFVLFCVGEGLDFRVAELQTKQKARGTRHW